MAGRRNYYFNQLVADGELDAGFNELEKADRFMVADFGLVGIAANATLTEHSPSPNLTLDVSGSGIIYDQQGRRISIPSLQVVDVSVDSNAVSTAVTTPGNEKWISVFAKFKRVLSDPRIDGNSNTVYFVDDESFEFVVVQGAEAAIGVATRPALLADGILLGDCRRVQGDTTVDNAKISSQSGSGLFSTTRRQDAFVLTAGSYKVRAGTPEASDQAVLDIVNSLIAGTITYAGSGTWKDGTTVAAGTLESAIDEVVSDLAASVSVGNNGAHRIGYVAGGNWFDGSTITATDVSFALDEVMSDLGSNASGVSGARKVGFDNTGVATWADSTGLASGSIYAAISEIISDLAGATGANKIGCSITQTWADGSNVAGANLDAALEEIVGDLATNTGATRIGTQATTATWADSTTLGGSSVDIMFENLVTALADAVGVGACGASRIGFAPQGTIAANNVEDAIVEVATEAAKTVDIQTFTTPGGNTWTKPTGAKYVEVFLVGGGGGGGSGRRGAAGTVRCGGGGGGGGGRTYAQFDAGVLGASETATVGAGGAGGAAETVNDSNGNSGSNGGASEFTLGGTVAAHASFGQLGLGGTTLGQSGGGLGEGDFDGTEGADSNTGAAGDSAQTSLRAASGGGGGGSVDATDTAFSGGDGGSRQYSYASTVVGGGNGVAPGGDGSAGGNVASSRAAGGGGGGGGAGHGSGAGGDGGQGGLYGGGGGGGGASTNGFNSGAGGAGRNGIVIVVTHF